MSQVTRTLILKIFELSKQCDLTAGKPSGKVDGLDGRVLADFFEDLDPDMSCSLCTVVVLLARYIHKK